MTFLDFGIDIKNRKAGNIKTRCPKCDGKTDLSVNIGEGVWLCHKPKCGWKGALPKSKPLISLNEKEYTKPQWQNNTELDDKIVQWFKGRGIGQQVLIDMKITCGVEYVPQVQEKRKVIQFNYLKNDELVNVKSRDGEKNFKLVSGAELIFYNIDAIKDSNEIIIVEGEMDALSYLEAGIKNVVSVPNGAAKGSLKLEYLDNCAEYFEGDKKIYIATDNDDAGFILKQELCRRLDVARCYDVNYGDCKDANEFLLKHGAIELEQTIKNAAPFPISGVIYANDLRQEYDDLYENGLPPGKNIGIQEFDKLLTFDVAQMTVITGIPSHGKSYFLDFIITRLSVLHKWRIGIFSPEHYPVKLHLSRLAEKLIGKHFSGENKMNYVEKDAAIDYIHDNMYFIRPDDETFALDNILSVSRSLVLKYGINALIIDPWNRLDHHMDKAESETNYISRMLDKLTTFKQKYGLHIFIVAHPTKIKKDKDTKEHEVPTLYDISGSSNFYNKPDNGMTVYRDFNKDTVRVYVQKVKYIHIGQMGIAEFVFNKNNGRYHIAGYLGDNSNYLSPTKESQSPIPHQPININHFPNSHPDKFTEAIKEMPDETNLPF